MTGTSFSFLSAFFAAINLLCGCGGLRTLEFQSAETQLPDQPYLGGAIWQGPNIAAHLFAQEGSVQSPTRIMPEYNGRFGLSQKVDAGFALWGAPGGLMIPGGDYGLQGNLKVMLASREATCKTALDIAPFVYGGSWIPAGDTAVSLMGITTEKEIRAWGFATGIKSSLLLSLDIGNNFRLYGTGGVRLVSGSFSYALTVPQAVPLIQQRQKNEEAPFIRRETFSTSLLSFSAGMYIPRLIRQTRLFIEGGVSQMINAGTAERGTGFYVGISVSTEKTSEE